MVTEKGGISDRFRWQHRPSEDVVVWSLRANIAPSPAAPASRHHQVNSRCTRIPSKRIMRHTTTRSRTPTKRALLVRRYIYLAPYHHQRAVQGRIPSRQSRSNGENVTEVSVSTVSASAAGKTPRGCTFYLYLFNLGASITLPWGFSIFWPLHTYFSHHSSKSYPVRLAARRQFRCGQPIRGCYRESGVARLRYLLLLGFRKTSRLGSGGNKQENQP